MYVLRISFSFVRALQVKQPLRQIMQAMLTCTDSVLGNLTLTLKRRGQWNNTLFVWSSDNGKGLPECSMRLCNGRHLFDVLVGCDS